VDFVIRAASHLFISGILRNSMPLFIIHLLKDPELSCYAEIFVIIIWFSC
jgi:hypothetical protein